MDIPSDIITSVKLENILSSTIRFKAPATRLGMMEEIIDGQDDEEGGKIEAISKKKAEDLSEIIRSGMQSGKKASFYASSKRGEQSVRAQSEIIQNTDDQDNTQAHPDSHHNVISVADEISKLGKLRNQGIITEAEFEQMKDNIIKKN